MPELTYLLIRIAAHIEINGPIPMGVSLIFSICIFVFVLHTHTHLYNNNNNISHYYMGRSMRAVPECTQIMSGRAKKAAPRANRSSWQAGTAWQVTWPFRRGGCPSPSCPFHPLFFCHGVHQTSGFRPCTRPLQPPSDTQYYNMLLIY